MATIGHDSGDHNCEGCERGQGEDVTAHELTLGVQVSFVNAGAAQNSELSMTATVDREGDSPGHAQVHESDDR